MRTDRSTGRRARYRHDRKTCPRRRSCRRAAAATRLPESYQQHLHEPHLRYLPTYSLRARSAHSTTLERARAQYTIRPRKTAQGSEGGEGRRELSCNMSGRCGKLHWVAACRAVVYALARSACSCSMLPRTTTPLGCNVLRRTIISRARAPNRIRAVRVRHRWLDRRSDRHIYNRLTDGYTCAHRHLPIIHPFEQTCHVSAHNALERLINRLRTCAIGED
jgi:hypothetical protein